MMHLFDLTTWNKKKKVMCTLLFLITLGLSFYLRIEGYLSIVSKLYSLTLFLCVSWIFLEMTHPSEVMLKSYDSMMKIIFYKWLNGMIYAFLMILAYYLFERCLDALNFMMINPMILLHLFMDIGLILVMMLPLIYLKHQSLGFIPAILYMFFQYFSDQFDSLILYQIIPFYQPMILTYRLAITYKLCYISLGYLLCLPNVRKH